MEYDGYHTYLPHHPGYLEDKSTTKIRPVFDQNKIRSLNEVLETGVRKILSISARVFYPIGFLAPRTLFLKIIYQQLWELGGMCPSRSSNKLENGDERIRCVSAP